MKLLSLDTSRPQGSVALMQGQEVTAEIRIASLETHSARLLRSIDFLLQSVAWQLKDLDLVAACIGPGSFTGIRIGVASALGFAQSLSIPFAGISALDALAEGVSFLEGVVGVVMDAQRGQLYYAEYEIAKARPRLVVKPGLYFPTDLERRLGRRHLYLVGDRSLRSAFYDGRQATGKAPWPRFIEIEPFLAGKIGRLALRRKRSWKTGESLRCDPLYIRPPDAIRRKQRKSR